MKKTYILSLILLLVTATSVFAQVDGEKPAREFLSDEFFPALNHWSDEAQKSKDLGNLAERAVMKLLFVSKVENSQINDELTRANTNKTGWYMFFKDRTSYGMPFHCQFQSAELKRHNGKELWFYVTYTVDYVDKTDWSNISSYNPNSSLFVKKRITVHDYMLVEASVNYIVITEVADHLPGASANSPQPVSTVTQPANGNTSSNDNGISAEELYKKGKEYYDKKDYANALKYFRKSADLGDASGQNGLGVIYQHGYGVSQDYSEAVRWYRKSAEQGNATAQDNLGYMYRYGYGVSQDYSEAVRWYRKSAEQGNASGQNRLGDMYYYGYGVSQDYSEAVRWYRKSADQGHSWGQYDLGYCYFYGRGVAQNKAEAKSWFQKAASQGHSDAKKMLDQNY